MKIGLLPLYIQLYDESSKHMRPRLEAFYKEITSQFIGRGVTVVTSPFCRIQLEFKQAITKFEEENVDAIVTLHMAYSPSLESIEVLANTHLPIIVFDTTSTLEFTPEQDPAEISYCHGIHGVMDMCSMLKRYGKPYAIAAGHYLESDCMERVCSYVRVAIAAKALNSAKVGLVGGAFDGMGDFAVEPTELKERFGVTIEKLDAADYTAYRAKVSAEELRIELDENQSLFDFDESVIKEDYIKSVEGCLALRKLVEENGYSAFSVNFRNVKDIPFLEACKAMERGIGYAGEGDGLTAAFTGALLNAYPETSFVEIFCPDWKNNIVLLSHMGEVNYRIIDGKPLLCRTAGIVDSYAGYARMKGGKGVYVNISRDKDDYQLLLASGEMMSYETDNFAKKIRGWMKPEHGTTAQFLEAHSIHGATHHSIFVYGATVEELTYFGKLLSMDVVVI